MAQKRPRIGVVGSSNVDLVTYVERMPVWGETIAAPRFEMSHGGKGANQAVAAAKLGAEVVMVSKVGDDMLGEGVLKQLRGFRRRDEARSARGRAVDWNRDDPRQRLGRQFHPHRQGRERRPDAGRRRGGGRGS